MSDQATKAQQFADLHVKGNPIIIYNVWDGGTTRALVDSGAKAIATGDHPVGYAHGFNDDDFIDFSFEIYINTIREVVKRAGDLPVSIDISNGGGLYGSDLKDRVKTVIEAGAIGVNFEDTTDDESELRPVEEQAERIKLLRETADEASVPIFINARTDLFAKSGKAPDELLDEAIKRANAYKEAGASGFFTPGLMYLDVIKQLADAIELPLNIIRLPGAPSTQELKDAGVSRISYGPVPQMQMIEWFKEQAEKALNGSI